MELRKKEVNKVQIIIRTSPYKKGKIVTITVYDATVKEVAEVVKQAIENQ